MFRSGWILLSASAGMERMNWRCLAAWFWHLKISGSGTWMSWPFMRGDDDTTLILSCPGRMKGAWLTCSGEEEHVLRVAVQVQLLPLLGEGLRHHDIDLI